MAEKHGEADGIDDSWSIPPPPGNALGTPSPAAPSAPSVGRDLPPSHASERGSAPDVPPPPAQLLTALNDFETAAPESFRAVTATSSAPATTERRAAPSPIDKRALVASAAKGKDRPTFAAAQRANIRMAAVTMGGLIVVGAVWMLSRSRPFQPALLPASSAAASALVAAPPTAHEDSAPPSSVTNSPSAQPEAEAQTSEATKEVPPQKPTTSPTAPAHKKPCGKSIKPCK